MASDMLNDWLKAYFPDEQPKPLPSPVVGLMHHDAASIPVAELDAGQAAVRQDINATGYGYFVSDEQCRGVASHVLMAAAAVRKP